MDLVKSITALEYNITNDYFVGQADFEKFGPKEKDPFSGVLVLTPTTLQSNRFAIQSYSEEERTKWFSDSNFKGFKSYVELIGDKKYSIAKKTYKVLTSSISVL